MALAKLEPPVTVNPVVVALPRVVPPETFKVPESTVLLVTAKAWVAVALPLMVVPTKMLVEVAVTPNSKLPKEPAAAPALTSKMLSDNPAVAS